MRKSRSITLSFSNNRLTEVKLDEWIFGTGYRIDKFELPIRTRSGSQKAIEGDLTLNGDLSIKDNKTILRDIDGVLPGEPSAGKKMITIGVSADYTLSSRFSTRVFFDKVINNPLISRSFPTRNTNIGFSVRFTLTNQAE
jgi:cell surface protein SprA